MGKHADTCNFKAPMGLSAQGKPFLAKTTERSHWLSFEAATRYAEANGLDIGYVIAKEDPFACIDFDVKDATNEPDPAKWTHPDSFEWFWDIAQRWDSYTEISRNGKGLHIWVRANIGEGRRRFPIEVYSQERFIISTGNVVLDKPLVDRQEWLASFINRYLNGSDKKKIELIEVEPVMSDDAIWKMACNAENAHNFIELCEGRWEQFGHPSQSEADLALMSMFTFYSESNEQCRRMFRQTKLGQREKVTKNNRYLNLTLITIRGRQAKEKVVEANGIELSGEFLRKLNGQAPLHTPELAQGVPQPPPPEVAIALAAPISAGSALAAREGLPWPPGFAGYLAQFIYDSAPRQVKEVAIVGALGLLAGITGKPWHIPGSGLNLYMILVAQSAIGKEAMHSGVSALITAAANRSPAIRSFVDFADFASGQALIKACAGNTCFVNVCGEWGHKLKRISRGDDGHDAAMASLRMVMTNLYQKSGPQSIVGGITYSNKDSNIQSVSGVAYSMIGETTPKTFYTALTESMMEDGFLSRFIIVEYDGDRPPLNPKPVREPIAEVTEYLGRMASMSQNMLSTGRYQSVEAVPEASVLMHDFEKECDKQINSTKEESWRQMWNRASLKVMRISALLAVADNYEHPVIQSVHVEWALKLIRNDIAVMRRKLEEGDVGVDDSSRENKLISVIKDYFLKPVPAGYGVPAAMRQNAIFPHMFVQKKCQKTPAFIAHRAGSTEALKMALRSLVENGYIMECDKTKMAENYSFHGKCYRVLKLPDFDAERLLH